MDQLDSKSFLLGLSFQLTWDGAIKHEASMTKEQKNFVTDYALDLSDDNIRYLTARLTDRYQGDLDESVNCMSQCPEMDEMLLSCTSATAFFNMCDNIRDIMSKECKRRNLSLRFISSSH